MNCHESRFLLFDYLDGKLSPETEKLLEAHIAECLECNGKLNELKDNRNERFNDPGLFLYLFKPSGGYKTFFLVGALLTILLFGILTYLYLEEHNFLIIYFIVRN